MGAKRNPEIELLLANLDDAFNKTSWHGPNLRGAIRGVPIAQAVWRPHPKRHNIAEIAVHCAYWKYAARRRLPGDKRGSFPLEGSNWFVVSKGLTAGQWRQYVKLLDGEHARLRAAIAEMTPARLRQVPKGSKVSNAKLIYGIAAHDVYHAGQIRLLKSLYGSK